MAVDSVFDRLVGELSTSERQELLTRIRFSEKVSDIPLIDVSGSGSYDFETVYRELTFLERLVLFFKRILTGREYATLVEEIAVKRVGRLLNLKAAGLISTREMELTEGFLEALESLADAAKSFRAPLKSALGIYRREFLAFLAGMELPLVQDELLKETNPDLQGEAQESVSVFDLKRLTEGLVQETFDAISESDRLSMYDHVQCLHALFDLSVFPFDRIANRFTGPEGGRRCPGQPVLGPLKDLAGLLRRLALPPKISVLEALFLFELRDRLNDPETALEGEIDGALRTAERSLAAIRSFNQTVPLVDIIRFITQDCDWTSQPKTGGEDWFVQFKQFWTDRLDERFYVYAALKKQQETVAKAKSLLRLARLPLLSNYRSELFADFGGVAHEHSIAFLLGWTNIIFEKDIGRWVKVFLLDGRFYKEDNRKELTDAYNYVERVPTDIQHFDRSLASEGKHGRLIHEIRESVASGERKKAMVPVLETVNADARRLVSSSIEHLAKMERVVTGLLYGHGEEAYDTISNLSQIGGRENGRLLTYLRTGHEKLAVAQGILAELYDIETGTSHDT